MSFLLLVDCFAAALIVGRTCVVLNEMSLKTRHSIRAAYVMMGLGAFLILIDPVFFDRNPELPEVLLHAGLAVLVVCNKRKRDVACPTVNPENGHAVYERGAK
jgi:drug/metabolite transporter (DMT)-like permease